MQYFRSLISLLLLLTSFSTIAKQTINYKTLPFNSSLKRKLLKDIILVTSDVNSLKGSRQEFHFQISGLHPKGCTIALRKLSRYETFSRYIDFIESSGYDDKGHIVYFRIKSRLLPFNMFLKFKFDRISSPGVYPFQFNNGFLKGLKGAVHISQTKNRCLFYAQADWRGEDSKIPDIVFEFFTKALSKILMEKLFSISRF